MRRFTSFDESHIAAANWLLWIAVFLGALALALVLATAAAGGTAYYGVEGNFGDGSATQSLLFDVASSVSSSERFSLRTWHYGGMNAASDSFLGGLVADRCCAVVLAALRANRGSM